MNKLFLASSSVPRQQLLLQSKIPFEVAKQDFDEKVPFVGKNLQQIVVDIAIEKMNHVEPLVFDDTFFVLTADTLVQAKDGSIFGKPVDREHAWHMIQAARRGMFLATGFCIERRSCGVIDRVVGFDTVEYTHDVPDHLIDWVLQNSSGMECAGAFTIEGIGLQFMKACHGSLSTVMGLPLYHVRNELDRLGFFK